MSSASDPGCPASILHATDESLVKEMLLHKLDSIPAPEVPKLAPNTGRSCEPEEGPKLEPILVTFGSSKLKRDALVPD